MVNEQATKFVQVIPPVAIKDNTAWVSGIIDTIGWAYCTIIVNLGATDIAVALLKVQEALTSGGSYSDVDGLVFGTSNNISGSASTLPSATDDDTLFAFDIDLKDRLRFLDLQATAGNGAAGSFMSAIAILSRGKQAPITAAQRGASQILRVE